MSEKVYTHHKCSAEGETNVSEHRDIQAKVEVMSLPMPAKGYGEVFGVVIFMENYVTVLLHCITITTGKRFERVADSNKLPQQVILGMIRLLHNNRTVVSLMG